MRRPPALSVAVRYPVTAGVAGLALVVTLAWHAGFDIAPLLDDGWWPNQPWRLLTSALPHVNPFHLIFNIYWLWVFGTLIEKHFGPARTLAMMALLAAGSAAAEHALSGGGVGLSGVGYGLFAFLWVAGRRDRRFDDAVDRQTVLLFVGWFFFCIALTAADVMAVGNIAHGVGAGLGALLGLAVARRRAVRIAASAGIVLAMAAFLAAAGVARPWVLLSPEARGHLWGQRGYEALMAGRNEDAMVCYRRAVDADPQQANYWYNLGIAYDRTGRHGLGQEAFARAAELEPNNPEYRLDEPEPPVLEFDWPIDDDGLFD